MKKYFLLFIIPLLFVVVEIQEQKERVNNERKIVISQINKNCGESIQLIRKINDSYYSFVCNEYGFEFYKKDDGKFVGIWENTQSGDELYTFSDKAIFNHVVTFLHNK